MALDRNYFNSIELNPIKMRYYDITAVDNILVDIRKQAELINRRYDDMHRELESVKAAREEYKTKGQALSQEIVALRNELSEMTQRAEEAEERAAAFETMADRNSRHLSQGSNGTESVQESIGAPMSVQPDLSKVEELYNSMKRIYLSGIETLDNQWQSFLKSVEDPGDISDLSSKIERIAKTIQEINTAP